MKGIKQAERDGLILTPHINRYLASNNSPHFSPTTADRIREIMLDNSNDVRHGRFGASSRGDCLRGQVFKFLGMERQQGWDPVLHAIFHDGHWRHMRWQAMGLEAGWFTHVETAFSVPDLRLKVSIDALKIGGTHARIDEDYGFELKGARFLPKAVPHKHALQVGTYFVALDENDIHLDKFVYLVDEKASQVFREFVIERDDAIIAAVRRELNALNTAIEEERLPRELHGAGGHAVEGKGECKACPFQPWCHDQGDEWPVDGQWRSDPAGQRLPNDDADSEEPEGEEDPVLPRPRRVRPGRNALRVAADDGRAARKGRTPNRRRGGDTDGGR